MSRSHSFLLLTAFYCAQLHREIHMKTRNNGTTPSRSSDLFFQQTDRLIFTTQETPILHLSISFLLVRSTTVVYILQVLSKSTVTELLKKPATSVLSPRFHVGVHTHLFPMSYLMCVCVVPNVCVIDRLGRSLSETRRKMRNKL